MKLTERYKLRKPEGTDPIDVADLNANADAVDAALAAKLDKAGVATDLITVFSQATVRANLLSGEKTSTSFGKIAKWLSDLRSGAFAEVTNALNITSSGYVSDARATKAVNDKFGNCTFSVQSDGAYVTYTPVGGADAVTKKLGSVVDGLINDGEVIGGSSLYLSPGGDTVTMHELAWDTANSSPKMFEKGDYLVTTGYLLANRVVNMDVSTLNGISYPSTLIGYAGQMTVRAFVIHVDVPVALYAKYTVVGAAPSYGTAFGFHETIKLDK